LAEYAERWEIDLLREPYRCVLTDYPSAAVAAARSERISALKQELLSHIRMQGLRGIHIVLEEGVLSIFPDRDSGGLDAVEAAYREVFERMSRGGTGAPVVSFSCRKRAPGELREAYTECMDTQRLARDLGM